MEKQLEIGDIIHGWDLLKFRRGSDMVIESLTKTLGKSGYHSFVRKINENVTKPNEDYVGEVKLKTECGSRRYFVLKKQND